MQHEAYCNMAMLSVDTVWCSVSGKTSRYGLIMQVYIKWDSLLQFCVPISKTDQVNIAAQKTCSKHSWCDTPRCCLYGRQWRYKCSAFITLVTKTWRVCGLKWLPLANLHFVVVTFLKKKTLLRCLCRRSVPACSSFTVEVLAISSLTQASFADTWKLAALWFWWSKARYTDLCPGPSCSRMATSFAFPWTRAKVRQVSLSQCMLSRDGFHCHDIVVSSAQRAL